VLQIENVFMNVSKGEVAKAGDLQKAFGTTDTPGIVKEVYLLLQDVVLRFTVVLS
jgi:ribosome maturation protein SDO1